MRLTIVVPSFGRPERTRRIINNILNQTINGWEAFVIGDGCSDFQKMIDSGEANNFIKKASMNGNILHCYNLDKNYGGYGYEIVNRVVKLASGEFIIFAGNDDILLNDHFEHYLSEIENTDYDFVYYNTFVAPNNKVRIPELRCDYIGHSELIVRTDLIRDYKHSAIYGHDWDFIKTLLDKSQKYKKSKSDKYTYIVTHLPGNSIDTID